MISALVGHFAGTAYDTGDLTLMVGGVGYLVRLSDRDRRAVSVQDAGSVALFIKTVIREDSHTLYGFLHERDRLVFERLCKVQGVGPSIALAMLSVHIGENILAIVRDKNEKALVEIPGVGKKTAANIIAEMKT